MRQHVASLAVGRVEVTGDGFHHLVHVLRARPGDRVTLFDGAGVEADAVILDVGEDFVTLLAAAPRPAARPALGITLLLSLLKGEKTDLVIQKATELGVTEIVPLQAARSVVRLDPARARARQVRWQKIAREAARQCGRADVPDVGEPLPVAAALRATSPSALRLLLHEAAAEPLAAALGGRHEHVAVAIGPEGGFAPEEVATARDDGWSVVALGRRILRAETAALAVLAILGFAAGDLGR